MLSKPPMRVLGLSLALMMVLGACTKSSDKAQKAKEAKAQQERFNKVEKMISEVEELEQSSLLPEIETEKGI